MSQWIQRIAVGAAGLAVATVAIAVIVVARRGPARDSALATRAVHVRDLARLSADTVERADGGVHIRPTVASALGVPADATLVAISGRAVTRPDELDAVIGDLEALHPGQWFVELARGGDHGGEHVIERWDLDGDLAAARRANPDPAAGRDPLIATVRRVGATRFELPRATLDAWIGDPSRVIAGVAAAHHVTNPDGFALDTVRPGSIAAALGFEDGDVIRAINGTELADLASVASLVVHGGSISVDLQRRGASLILNYAIQ